MGIMPVDQPDLRPVSESGELYIVFSDWNCASKSITVPEGFRTDGASAPRWSLTLIGLQRDGIHRAAAVMHDWLYENRGSVVLTTGTRIHYDRKYVDRLFHKMLAEAGLKRWHRALAYAAVRLFGWIKWED